MKSTGGFPSHAETWGALKEEASAKGVRSGRRRGLLTGFMRQHPVRRTETTLETSNRRALAGRLITQGLRD